MRVSKHILAFLVLLLLVDASQVSASGPSTSPTGTTRRISVASNGTEGNGHADGGRMSADGRYIAFSSGSSNLVPGDTNGVVDALVHDRQTGTTTRVSVASDGTEADGASWPASLSSDGRYIGFYSEASNLVPGDGNGVQDVFLHDRQTGQTTRVSVAYDGGNPNDASAGGDVSADGRYVAFSSTASNLVVGDTNGARDAYVHDRQAGQTTRVSVSTSGLQGNGYSSEPQLSADGRYVTFLSESTNLVPGDTNAMADVFVHDRHTGETTRVSVASDGTQGDNHSLLSSISADGRWVAFESFAGNLVPDDTNGRNDVFVHDRQTGETTRASVTSDGAGISGGTDSGLALSPDGRYIVFGSTDASLLPGAANGQHHVFIHDREAGETAVISVADDGALGNGWSGITRQSLSSGGRYVAFWSMASNLVAGDTNSTMDVFVHDRQTAVVPTAVSLNGPSEGGVGIPHTFTAAVSPTTATLPLTYTWSPAPEAGQGTASATYRWATAGAQALTVTVQGSGMTVTDTLVFRALDGAVGVVAPASGGIVTDAPAEGKSTTLVVPVGALTEATTLVIAARPEPEAPPSGLRFAGRAFAIDAYRDGEELDSVSFAAPATLTLEYTDAEVAGLDERTLTLHTWDGTAWVDAATRCSPASSYMREPEENRLSVGICHLSEFALFGIELRLYLPLTIR